MRLTFNQRCVVVGLSMGDPLVAHGGIFRQLCEDADDTWPKATVRSLVNLGLLKCVGSVAGVEVYGLTDAGRAAAAKYPSEEVSGG